MSVEILKCTMLIWGKHCFKKYIFLIYCVLLLIDVLLVVIFANRFLASLGFKALR